MENQPVKVTVNIACPDKMTPHQINRLSSALRRVCRALEDATKPAGLLACSTAESARILRKHVLMNHTYGKYSSIPSQPDPFDYAGPDSLHIQPETKGPMVGDKPVKPPFKLKPRAVTAEEAKHSAKAMGEYVRENSGRSDRMDSPLEHAWFIAGLLEQKHNTRLGIEQVKALANVIATRDGTVAMRATSELTKQHNCERDEWQKQCDELRNSFFGRRHDTLRKENDQLLSIIAEGNNANIAQQDEIKTLREMLATRNAELECAERRATINNESAKEWCNKFDRSEKQCRQYFEQLNRIAQQQGKDRPTDAFVSAIPPEKFMQLAGRGDRAGKTQAPSFNWETVATLICDRIKAGESFETAITNELGKHNLTASDWQKIIQHVNQGAKGK